MKERERERDRERESEGDIEMSPPCFNVFAGVTRVHPVTVAFTCKRHACPVRKIMQTLVVSMMRRTTTSGEITSLAKKDICQSFRYVLTDNPTCT